MTLERKQEVEFIRSEIIGPSRGIINCDGKDKVSINSQNTFVYPAELPGPGIPLFWNIHEKMPWQEIIHYRNETPMNKYGAGLLYPGGLRKNDLNTENKSSNSVNDTNQEEEEQEVSNICVDNDNQSDKNCNLCEDEYVISDAVDDDFDITSPDIYRPSTMGITFGVLGNEGELIIRVPTEKQFFWQHETDEPFQVNGRYQKCEKMVKGDSNESKYPAWRRFPATTDDSFVSIPINNLKAGIKQEYSVPLLEGSPLSLIFEVFPRNIHGQWIITVVLRNNNNANELNNNQSKITHTLFQSYFEVSLNNAEFIRYPEGTRPFEQLDIDEQALALLYQDSATWAIGHGCAAGWDVGLGKIPTCLYADVLPAVELPSMTPDIIDDNGNSVSLSMRQLSELPSYDISHPAWQSLDNLLLLYREWIHKQRNRVESMDDRFHYVANHHIDACQSCHDRIKSGIEILKNDESARTAFKLANKSMLLQQIASKQLNKRSLKWDGEWVVPEEPVNIDLRSPDDIFKRKLESGVGSWRAFQIAFLLMSLDGLINEEISDERNIVDLIWFPTGGGKTEAYLGVAAFYLFHQRLLMKDENNLTCVSRDGTNVFMRYTLRMLTTQQFQRAASLICAMEYIRAENSELNLGTNKFSLGLWIGGDGSPNNCDIARTQITKYKKDKIEGNPLVLTECPWCRSEIGTLKIDPRTKKRTNIAWHQINSAGFGTTGNNEPVLKCSDIRCHFGDEFNYLPIEVIDERIYKKPPSIFIGTADKFAMLAYKPEAGSLFGRKHNKNGEVIIKNRPPGIIIQDEFHLISGPLGTLYGVYESVIEKLCSFETEQNHIIKPKIIASTATIRGATEQVKAVYAREKLQLFPSPGLLMKDSFFGRYATSNNGDNLKPGRLYLGIHAHGYGSVLTTQVRAFTAALFRSCFFPNENKDPWWTLLAFYNSLRELGGASTLFSSDIASRLKNYSFRYGINKDRQRYLGTPEELTSRKGQAELVQMMERLSLDWSDKGALDVCLASNIIEVGVDIDRLSLMAVVGQPKSTAQYIQVTGRVGRKWWERPGLILAMFNPAKSRDRSHFEQFHSYHRRLYEKVEPTSATPFSIEAINRSMSGALLLWARQFYDAPTPGDFFGNYKDHLEIGRNILMERCTFIIDVPEERKRVMNTINNVYDRLLNKWKLNPQLWQEYPQNVNGEYLMLWPGQYATELQKRKGETIPSSMRNVDSSAYLQISDFYI